MIVLGLVLLLVGCLVPRANILAPIGAVITLIGVVLAVANRGFVYY